MDKILAKLHIFFFLYILWGGYTAYEEQNAELLALQDRIPALQNNIKREEQKKSRTKEFLKDVDEAKGRIEAVASEVEKLQRQLPAEVSDPENLGLIKNIAEQMNIKNVILAPGEEENKGFYLIKNYNFKGTGTFLQFLIFFEKIAENERLLNINEFELIKVQEERRGRFQLINATVKIGAYKYNSSYKEETGIDKIEDAFTKPAVGKGKRAPKNRPAANNGADDE